MLYLIIFLILLYLVFRLLTTVVIPRYVLNNVKKYQEKFKKDNPHIFKKEDKKKQ